MRLAADLAGFSLGEADTLRKAMGKKDRELMATQREKFVAGCKANKIDGRKAERIWDLIEKFAGYGFNKCHAACYGVVAYQTAYLKANYPVEFMAALLTSEMEQDGQDRPVHGGVPGHGPRGRAARRQRLRRATSRWRGRRSASGWPRSRTWAPPRSSPSCGPARRTAASARSTTSARASTCAWSTGGWSRASSRRARSTRCRARAPACSPRSTRRWTAASASSATARRGRSRSSTSWAAATPSRPRAPAAAAAAVSRSGRRRSCSPTRRRCWASTSPAIRSSSYREMARRIGALSAADLAARSTGARVLLLGQVSGSARARPRAATAWPSPRSSWWTAAVPLTIFPEPSGAARARSAHQGPVIVRGRIDDSDKGRVVLAEEIKPLEDAMGNLAPGRQRPRQRQWSRERDGAARAHLPHPRERRRPGPARSCSPR